MILNSPLTADYTFRTIYDIRPQTLASAGIRLLLADLDNTLVPYGVPEPDEAVRAWKGELTAAGVTLFLLSNSRKSGRAQRFAESLGIPYIGHAGKPKTPSFVRAMEEMGCTPQQTAIVGDQIFTDILGGNRAGVTTLLVEPIRLAGNPGRYLRYAVEWPFRARSKRRTL